MTNQAKPHAAPPRYTLDDYETIFADRHLLHGVIAKWAKERPDTVAIIEYDTGREFTYRQNLMLFPRPQP